jgi:hypothetical protein
MELRVYVGRNRRAIAQEQPRVRLIKREATNAELAGVLRQKALTPAAVKLLRHDPPL